MSWRVTTVLLAALGVLSLIVRYPEDLHAIGRDTFYMAGYARSIELHGALGWVHHPVSALGQLPGGVPFAGPTLFATISVVTGIPIGASIVLTGLFLGVVSVLLGFVLGRAITGSSWVGLTLAAVFSLSPRLVVFTLASGSTRAFLFLLFPLVLVLLIKAYRSPANRQIFLLLALAVLASLALFHRAFLLALPVIPAYLFASMQWKQRRTKHSRTLRGAGYLLAFSAILGLAILTRAVSQFLPRETDYSTGALLEGDSILIVIANMAIDYTSSLGILALLIPIGILVLLRQQVWPFETRFILLLALLYAPVLVAGQYAIIFVLPILALVAVLGLRGLSRNRWRRPQVAAGLLVAAIVSTAVSGTYVISQWQAFQGPDLLVDSEVVATSFYLGDADSRSFFISNDWSSATYKIWSLSKNPPVAWDLGIPLLEGVIGLEELDLQFRPSPLGLYSPTSGLMERTHWVSIMTQDPTEPRVQHLILLYGLQYFVERQKFPNLPTIVVFLSAIHETQYKLYENSRYTIWTVPHG